MTAQTEEARYWNELESTGDSIPFDERLEYYSRFMEPDDFEKYQPLINNDGDLNKIDPQLLLHIESQILRWEWIKSRLVKHGSNEWAYFMKRSTIHNGRIDLMLDIIQGTKPMITIKGYNQLYWIFDRL